MAALVLRRLGFGLVALFVGMTASFFFWASTYPPLRGTPLGHAYWVWLKGLVTGHTLTHGLLPSFDPVTGQPITTHLLSVLGTPIGRTMALLALTSVLVVVGAGLIGCLAAATRGSVLDLVLRIGSYVTWAVPGFVLAILLQEAFGRIAGGWGLGWFPYVGWAGQCPNGQGTDFTTGLCPAAGTGAFHVANVLYHLTLPAVALAAGFIGLHARYLRNSLLDALGAPYVTVARAKGLSERRVLFHHALRNALVTVVPALFSDFGWIFGATFVVDVVFQLGGVGSVFVSLLQLNADALVPLDTWEMQLILLFAGGVMLIASVLSETIGALLDPRVRAG